MTDIFRDLYDALVNAIKEIENTIPESRLQVEASFHQSERVKSEMLQVLSSVDFPNEAAEIAFFKHQKPKFLSLVEFYSIRYKADLFVPERLEEQGEFWKSELQRSELFLARNRGLLAYLRSGDTSHDRAYFMRMSDDHQSAPQDLLVARLYAHEKYIQHIQGRILPDLPDVNP